jgi:hypothetical protein
LNSALNLDTNTARATDRDIEVQKRRAARPHDDRLYRFRTRSEQALTAVAPEAATGSPRQSLTSARPTASPCHSLDRAVRDASDLARLVRDAEREGWSVVPLNLAGGGISDVHRL